MAPKTTGSVETYTRADGTKYYRARIRLADHTRVRVNIPEMYNTDERRALYAASVQEREDKNRSLFSKRSLLHGSGSAYQDKRSGKYYAQVSMGGGLRRGVLCPSAQSLEEAKARAKVASEMVATLPSELVEGAIVTATTVPFQKLTQARRIVEAGARARKDADRVTSVDPPDCPRVDVIDLRTSPDVFCALAVWDAERSAEHASEVCEALIRSLGGSRA